MFALGEIVVSEPPPVIETIATKEVVTAEEIKTRGVRTLDEALELLPGLNVRTGGDGTPRVDVRGFRTRHVQLLLNGIPISNTFDGQFDPTLISVENIALIKVTKGASSVVYGEGGNAAVINIVTKAGRPGIHGALTTQIADGGRHWETASVSGSSGKFDAYVSGSIFDRDAYPLSHSFSETKDEDGGFRENSDRMRRNVSANFGYAISDQAEVGLTLGYVKGENGKPPVTNYDKNDSFSKKPKYERQDDAEGYSAQLAGSIDPDGPLSFRGWLFFNTLQTVENRYDDDGYDTQTEKGSFHERADTEIYGASLQSRYDLAENGAVTLALKGENNSWDAAGFAVKKSKTEDIDNEHDLQIYNAGLEYEVEPVQNLGLVAGVGVHHLDKDGGSDESDFSYLVGLRYDLFEATRLKASHARKVRFPSIRQLYEQGSGNPDLEAEVTYHYEVGIEQMLAEATMATATIFWIDAVDFIEKNVTDEFRNFEDYRFRGFELGLETGIVDNLFFKAAYTYLDSENRSEDDDRDELQHRPRDKFTVQAKLTMPYDFMVYAAAHYVGEQVFYNNESPQEQKDLNNYTLVDVRLSKGFLDNSIELSAGVENLFDEDYETSYGLPQAGRTIYGGAAYRF